MFNIFNKSDFFGRLTPLWKSNTNLIQNGKYHCDLSHPKFFKNSFFK